ncbi:MAG: DUF1592 domain-containing protein [Planctomycetota bacterium]
MSTRFLPPMRMLVAALTLTLAVAPVQAFADGDTERLQSLLSSYCLDCHDAASREGDRDFEWLRLPLDDHAALIAADEIIDQVTLREMPPEDADAPTDDERIELVELLRGGIADARQRLESTGGRTVMRRLSHREYENTLATLLDRRVDTLGLTADFPKENTREHLDNIGSALVTSGFLLDQYFQSADRLIETRLGKPAMPPQDWHFTDHFVQYEELRGPHESVFDFEYLCLYEQPNTDTRQGGYGHIEDFLDGVPVSGLYKIQVHAQSMHRDTHYDPKIFRIDFSEPFQLAVVPGDVRKGHIHYPQAIEPILAKTVVPDDAPEWLTFTVWLDAGQTPRFIFPNGPYESRASVIETNKRYKKEFKKPKDGVNRSTLLREGKLPHIRIDEIKIHGPLPEDGGSREEVAVFGPGGFHPDLAIEQLEAFARRAYRRPLTREDRKRIERIYERRIDDNAGPRQAALDSVKMILCSPSFLYLLESTEEETTRLQPHDLAARWSYALWAAPPDTPLSSLADAGKLDDPAIAKTQIERMLDDPRSEQFVSGFLDAWLGLREIGSLPPPRKRFKDYYAKALPEAMKSEARLFFKHLLEHNGSATDLIDSDYTFVDKRLATMYDLPEAKRLRQADGFQKIDLPDRSQRGGVLGMAAVLTASANGVETSPVTRGVWVLENLLGMGPPPPPDEVPSIDANVSGATTIREKLELHRQDAACNVCHRKIDPMGFALENFDPIGQWRKRYPKAKGEKKAAEIDPTGTFPSGESYANFATYKRLLMETRKDVFMRHLVEKMLAYAAGREIEPSDRFVVDDIVQRVREDDDGLRTMVVEVLQSTIVRSR